MSPRPCRALAKLSRNKSAVADEGFDLGDRVVFGGLTCDRRRDHASVIPIGGVGEDFAECFGDLIAAGCWIEAYPDPSVHDAGGDVQLVPAHGEADDGHAGSERFDGRTVTPVGDDGRRVEQDLRVGDEAMDRDVGRRLQCFWVDAATGGGDTPDREGAHSDERSSEGVVLVLEVGAHGHQDQRFTTLWRPPAATARKIIQSGTDMLHVWRERAHQIEGCTGEHKDEGSAAGLVEHVIQRRESLLGAGNVERWQRLVPYLHRLCSHEPVPLALVVVGSRQESPVRREVRRQRGPC